MRLLFSGVNIYRVCLFWASLRTIKIKLLLDQSCCLFIFHVTSHVLSLQNGPNKCHFPVCSGQRDGWSATWTIQRPWSKGQAFATAEPRSHSLLLLIWASSKQASAGKTLDSTCQNLQKRLEETYSGKIWCEQEKCRFIGRQVWSKQPFVHALTWSNITNILHLEAQSSSAKHIGFCIGLFSSPGCRTVGGLN